MRRFPVSVLVPGGPALIAACCMQRKRMGSVARAAIVLNLNRDLVLFTDLQLRLTDDAERAGRRLRGARWG
jgi:hypothetical protein